MSLDYSQKAGSLSEKMNKLTASFGLADEMLIEGDDIVGFVEEKTNYEVLPEDELTATEMVNLQGMLSDFKYIRTVLKETTENGRRVLNSVTLDLLDAEDETRASLILSFAELNKSISDNMKVFMTSYKTMAEVLLNIDKVKKADKANITTNNSLTINNTETISTTDLIEQLREIQQN